MNLFIIPSWYPSQSQPISGIFTLEQVEAIAELCPQIKVIVSTWGHGDGYISPRNPLSFLHVMLWWSRQKRNQIFQRNKIVEVFNPAVTWTNRLPFGGVRREIGVNRLNFKLATDRFGKIDLIHAHVSYPAGYIASLLAKEFGVPYVLTEHMSPFPFSSLMRNDKPIPEINQAFCQAATSIAVSSSLAKRVASWGYREPTVVPNLIDERRFLTGEPQLGKFVFFTLCNLTEQKGIDNLLEAIALWNPPANQFEFRVGGDGPMRARYQSLAERLRISDRVRWLGPISRKEAPRLFSECHIYVMPSRHETFGVVFAEAIASGKPIIATRCGGPECIVNKTNGVLVEVNDVSGLTKAMRDMAKNWSKYNPQEIRADFEVRFSRHQVVNQLKEIYSKILQPYSVQNSPEETSSV